MRGKEGKYGEESEKKGVGSKCLKVSLCWKGNWRFGVAGNMVFKGSLEEEEEEKGESV